MLIQFTFSNFKCFKEETVLNLVASNTRNTGYYAHKTDFKYSALKALAVFGANASGKTKLFEAMNFMRSVICPPRRDEKIPVFDYWQTIYDSFRLNTQSENDESVFECVFILNGIQYRYGFSLNSKEILSEWLYRKLSRETLVFCREKGENYNINKRYISEKIFKTVKSAKMISPAVPLLSILATFNDTLSKLLVEWFKSIVIISANDLRSIDALTTIDKKKVIVGFLKAFDINIEDIELHETDVDNIPDKIKAIIGEKNLKGKFYDGINTTHKVYNNLYERVNDTVFSMERDESFGTNRLFSLSWPIINSLKKGTVLFIDEMDSGIHTNIIKIIIGLYYRCSSNAQLIINTQNSSLLDASDGQGNKLFRKDQVYIVNKNRYGESSVLPITDFRNDLRANLEKIYLAGGISGVPYVDINALLGLIEN